MAHLQEKLNFESKLVEYWHFAIMSVFNELEMRPQN